MKELLLRYLCSRYRRSNFVRVCVTLLALVSFGAMVTILAVGNLETAHLNRLTEVRELMRSPGTVQMDDPMLVEIIKKQMLDWPDFDRAYNLTRNVTRGQYEQAVVIDELLGSKTGGFFVEAGAWNGEYLSNSLFLEKERKWNGLLVEANNKAYSELKEKNRKAASVGACLSLDTYPEMVTFDGADVFGGVIDNPKVGEVGEGLLRARKELGADFRKEYSVQCLPLYSLLLALGNPTVDYFSLDVEGAELAILKTIPWDKVDIRTLTVEINHGDKDKIVEYLEKQGYAVLREFAGVDLLFAKGDLATAAAAIAVKEGATMITRRQPALISH